MAPIMVDYNKAIEENPSTNPEPQQAGISQDDFAKEPTRNETEDFDVSDCFTNDFDDVRGGRMIGLKNNGSFVNIVASQGTVDGARNGSLTGDSCKDEDPTTIVINLTDDEDSQDSLDTRIRRTLAKASLITKKEIDENEDPEIVKLKEDFYQNTGAIDYDLDLGEDEKPFVKIKVEPKVEPKTKEQPMVIIMKEHNSSPVNHHGSQKIKPKRIPTIDLTSSDEEIEIPKKEESDTQAASNTLDSSRSSQSLKTKKTISNTSVCSEYVVVKAENEKLKIRRKKRKLKKRRQEMSIECESIEKSSPIDSENDVDKEYTSSKDHVTSPDEVETASVNQKDVESKDKVTVEELKTNRRRSDESDYVRATISKELEATTGSSEQSVEENETGPFVNTDIALEDLLNDFLEDETVPQNPSQVLFPTVSNEEDKVLLNSPPIDCERMLLAELDNILKDDKPPVSDKIEEQPLFTYTIYEPDNSAPLNITVNPAIVLSQSEPEETTRIPKPRFRIVDGRLKYPPPLPVKKRPGRPPKGVDHPSKSSRKQRYESDEEYIPSFARTRRIPLRPRKARRRAPRAQLVAPTENYSTELQLRPEPDPEDETLLTEQQQPDCQSPLTASDGIYMNMPSLEEGQAANGVPKKVGRKRGRAPKHHIEDYFCPSPGDKKDSQTKKTPVKDSKKSQPQVKRRKKRSRISSCSTNSEDETTATESISLAGTSSTITTREADHEQLPAVPEPRKTDEMRVVLSPLTDEKIEKLSKCNTPKKARALSKASQTELEGLTWRIELNQIDFHSKYFEKLYQLIKNGREQNNLRRGNKNFEGVVMVDRDAVLPTPQEKSPQRPPAAASDHARSNIEQLLFERAEEVEYVPAARVDPSARERMKQSVRSNFRIPKIAKQPSRSPQVVTSSTQHDNEQHCKEDDSYQTSTGGYSNDVAPDPRRQITIGSRSPLRVENTLNSNRSEVPGHVGDDIVRPPMAPIRRTIRNDQVLAPTVAQPSQQPQPVQNGFPTYGPPEQAPPQPSRYQGNVFQQQLRPSQQHLGAYMASSQEMDVKPNISMNPQAALIGPGMMNPTRIFDSFSFMCQLTMMQMMQQQQQQQQQLQYQALNPGGQMFPGPSIAPPTVNNPTPAPPMSAQMMPPSGVGPRFVEVSDGGQQDEVSDQISQIFGCIDNLKGRCIKNPCQYSHTLPTETTLRQMLLSSAQDIVMTTYQFIVGQDNLFLRYFPVYAEVMGRKNMRHQLIDAVPHCEQSKRAFSHYRFIVEGLTINGTLTRSKAIQLVLEKHKKINFDQINVLINLILETGEDVPQFLTWLEHFSQVQDYHYEIPSINRLLKFCVCFSRSTNALLQGTVANVAKLVYRLVLSVATGKEPFVDTDALVDYAELLMKSNLGLDHEKILDKYRKNELASSATRR